MNLKSLIAVFLLVQMLFQPSEAYGQGTGKTQLISSFSGVVILEDESDSISQKTKVLLGDVSPFHFPSSIVWVDSLVIWGELSGYNLPHYNESHGYTYDGSILYTTDSIYFIEVKKDGVNSNLDVSYKRQSLNKVAQAVYSGEHIYTLNYDTIGSKISRLDKHTLLPDQVVQLSDSIFLLSTYEFSLETVHHRDSSYLWIYWSNMVPHDTITVADTLGEFKQMDYFINFTRRAVVVKDDIYHIIAPDNHNSNYDTIYSHKLSPGLELAGSAEVYYYVDTLINDTTIVKTLSIHGYSWSDTTKLPGHAVHIQTVDLQPITYLYYDTLSRNIYRANYTVSDSLTSRAKTPIAMAPIHFVWVGIKPVGSNTQTASYYPNPASDILYFNTSSNPSSSPYQIEIFNTNGSLIKSLQLSARDKDLEIPLTGLPSGLLVIHVTGDNLFEILKVIHH